MAGINGPKNVTDARTKQADGPVGPWRDHRPHDDHDPVLKAMPQCPRTHAGTADEWPDFARAARTCAESHAANSAAGSMVTRMGHS